MYDNYFCLQAVFVEMSNVDGIQRKSWREKGVICTGPLLRNPEMVSGGREQAGIPPHVFCLEEF